MAYSTIPEVRDMIKDDTVNVLIDDEYIASNDEREARVQPLIGQAIADGDGEIDGYLAKRYPVPLSPPPKIINKFSKDIALYNLFSRIGIDENSEQKNILNRYQSAIKFLTLLAEGKVSIGTEGGNDTEAAARNGFAVRSNPRIFSRDTMRGM